MRTTRFSAFVQGIVASDAFLMKAPAATVEEDPAENGGDIRTRKSRVMNYLSGKHLERRTFLKGVGGVIALPFLDAMRPAGEAWAPDPVSHGSRSDAPWWPSRWFTGPRGATSTAGASTFWSPPENREGTSTSDPACSGAWSRTEIT